MSWLFRYIAVLLLLLIAGCASVKPEQTVSQPAATPPAAQPAATQPAPAQPAATQPAAAQPAAAQPAATQPGVRPAAPATPQPAPAAAAPPVTNPAPPTSRKDAPPVARTPAPVATTLAPVARTPASVAAAPKPAAPPVAAPPAPAAPTTLDLNALEAQLKATKAIGVFTKISLKNKVDDLMKQFRDYYQGKSKLTMTELRQSYDLLMMKVLSLLQDSDQKLASSIVSSREAIWGLLADPKKFAALQV